MVDAKEFLNYIKSHLVENGGNVGSHEIRFDYLEKWLKEMENSTMDRTYEAIEDMLVEKICEAHYTDIEDFLGYPISADVMENLEDRVREVLGQMSEEEMFLFEQKYLM